METAAWIAAGVVSLAAVVKAIPTLWDFVVAAAKAPLIIQRVADEFAPNGGGSLRDAIDRLEATLVAHVADDVKHPPPRA